LDDVDWCVPSHICLYLAAGAMVVSCVAVTSVHMCVSFFMRLLFLCLAWERVVGSTLASLGANSLFLLENNALKQKWHT